MRNGADFYSTPRQYLREWQALWAMHRTDTLLAGLYALAGFYIFNSVGRSQVDDVITPFIMASVAIAYLAYLVLAPQARGETLSYFVNLPRGRMTSWHAQVAYLVAVIAWMEGLTVLGAWLKLGTADITPIVRLHPEPFALPFFALAATAAAVNFRLTWPRFFLAVLGIIASVAFVVLWARAAFPEGPEEYNNYLPPRGLSLAQQGMCMAGVFAAAGLLLMAVRAHWRQCELGDTR